MLMQGKIPDSTQSFTSPVRQYEDMSRQGLSCCVVGQQGEFAMLVFGVARDFEEAKSRLENLSEIVRQSGAPLIASEGLATAA